MRQRLEPGRLDRLATGVADPVAALLDPVEGPVGLGAQIGDVVGDGEFFLALEGERAGVGEVLVIADLSRHLGLRETGGRLLDGRELVLQFLALLHQPLADRAEGVLVVAPLLDHLHQVLGCGRPGRNSGGRGLRRRRGGGLGRRLGRAAATRGLGRSLLGLHRGLRLGLGCRLGLGLGLRLRSFKLRSPVELRLGLRLRRRRCRFAGRRLLGCGCLGRRLGDRGPSGRASLALGTSGRLAWHVVPHSRYPRCRRTDGGWVY